jgi:molecular chaperone GrpE
METQDNNISKPEADESTVHAAANESVEAAADAAARLQIELDETKDRMLRALAEAENARRRHEKDKQDLLKFGVEGFVRELLPVIDGLEKAIPQEVSADANDKERALLEGIKMVWKQLMQVMEKQGLQSIEAAGVPFDPNVHQAIQMIPEAEVKTDTVKQVFAKGYSLNGRVVRAAMVSVNVPQ